jgi:tRNA-2-methylthio-N6-dimethylallyladenosine synthase
VFSFKYSARPNTPALGLEDAIPEDEKSHRLELLMAKQREIQVSRYAKYMGTTLEVMIEGYNDSRRQWIGRTSQNKTLNFAAENSAPKIGSYAQVLVTRSFPNSLVGELVV